MNGLLLLVALLLILLQQVKRLAVLRLYLIYLKLDLLILNEQIKEFFDFLAQVWLQVYRLQPINEFAVDRFRRVIVLEVELSQYFIDLIVEMLL